MTRPYVRQWDDTIMKRLDLPVAPASPKTTFASTLPGHIHLWAEVGYSGTLSPAYADVTAASAAIRELAEELNVTIGASATFPLLQVFLKVGLGKSVRVTISKERCMSSCQNPKDSWT